MKRFDWLSIIVASILVCAFTFGQRIYLPITEMSGTPTAVMPISTKTTDYTIQQSDYCILADASNGPIKITLPSALNNSGRTFAVKRINQGAQDVTISTTDSSIDMFSGYVLTQAGECMVFISDGMGWKIIASHTI